MSMPTFPNITIEDLIAEHVLATPRAYDWKAWAPDDSEDRPWDWAEVVECPKCKRFVVACNGQIEEHDESEGHVNSDDDEEIDAVHCNGSGEYSDSAEGPMMSYWYPCTFPNTWPNASDMADAARLLDGPVCAVKVGNEEGIALTGGGMDLSWEICEAYVRLGCLPPVHYARDLPAMAGLRLDARHLAILKACERSIEVARSWLQRGLDDLARHRAVMSQNTLGPANMADIPADEILLAEVIAQGNNAGLHHLVDQVCERGYVDDPKPRRAKGGK